MSDAADDELISRHICHELFALLSSSARDDALVRRHWWFAFLIGNPQSYRNGAASTVEEVFRYVVAHRDTLRRELGR